MAKEIDQSLSSNEVEYVEVNIKIPKRITDYVRNHCQLMHISEQEYYCRKLICSIRADIETLEGTINTDKIIEVYRLKEIFESHTA